MTARQFKLAISALAVAGATTALVVQHQALGKLREQNQSLQQQIAQLQSDNAGLSRREAAAKLMLRLPAPHVPVAAPPPKLRRRVPPICLPGSMPSPRLGRRS